MTLEAEEKAQNAMSREVELRAVIHNLEDQLRASSSLASSRTEGTMNTSDYDTDGETPGPSELLSTALYSDDTSVACSESRNTECTFSLLSTPVLVASTRTFTISGPLLRLLFCP